MDTSSLIPTAGSSAVRRQSTKRSNGGSSTIVVLAVAVTVVFEVTLPAPSLVTSFCPIQKLFRSTPITSHRSIPNSVRKNIPTSIPLPASIHVASKKSIPLMASSSSSNDRNNNGSSISSIPPNEFSRPVEMARIGRTIRSRRTGPLPAQGDGISMTISANADECQALADRFGLTRLSKVVATVQVRPAPSIATGSAGGAFQQSSSTPPVEVEGTIIAHLTQTCVRTNENFEVDVEFPIFALVRPISMAMMASDGTNWLIDDVIIEPSSSSSSTAGSMTDDNDASRGRNDNKDKSNKKKSKHQKRNKGQSLSQQSRQVFNLKDVMELQAAIVASEEYRMGNNDDNNNDDNDDGYNNNNNNQQQQHYEAAASLVEDESIYSLATGILDVGELVAQTLWLQLDPYPKKPGTGPIEITITG